MMHCAGQTCASCRFWTRQGPQLANATRDPRALPDQGVCQAHGPVIVQRAGMDLSLFPVTHESRFCGEWQPMADGGGDGQRVVPFPAGFATRVAA